LFTPETYRDDAKYDLQLPTTDDNEKAVSSSNNSTRETLHDDSDGDSQHSSSTVMSLPIAVASLEDNNNFFNKKDQEKSVVESAIKVDIAVKVAKSVLIEEKPKKKFFNPFAPFALLRHPFVFLPSLTAGFFFGAMFATEAILPEAFKETYGLNSWQTGLCYLGAGIGNLSGAMVGGRLSDRLLLRSRCLRGGKPKVEDRLTANIWIAGFIFNPLGLLVFGWIVQYKLSFWGAIVGFGIQCFGNVQVMTTVTAYLVDSMPGRGAAASAAANFVRFGFACVLTLISTPMVSNLGAGWTCTLFACLSWFGMTIVIILKTRGEHIRSWSGY
jgi:predicted MFS family arabinose efflux permease